MARSDGFALTREAMAGLRRERLSPAELMRHQHEQLAGLLRYASEHSVFHRERIAGRDLGRDLELADLAPMSKADLVERYEDVVTDPRLTRETLERHVGGMGSEDVLLFNEFRVLVTGGTSGVTTYVPFDRASWARVLGANMRVTSGLGLGSRPFPRKRLVSLTAGGPMHMTYRMAVSSRSRMIVRRRLDVAAPLAELGAALQEFRPDVVTGYPSVLAALADEQRDGRFTMSPALVFTGSEQLLPSAQAAITEAWGRPYDLYAATEPGGLLAWECREHAGLHLREDDLFVEAVDGDDRPVPDGQPSVAILVTSWVNRALPLIRYRIDDGVTLTSEPCRCGRAGRRIAALSGRREDVVQLHGPAGETVPVRFVEFLEAVEQRPEVARFQVVQRADGITVSVVARQGAGPWTEQLQRDIEARLRALGAVPPPLAVAVVPELERPTTPGAKLPLVRSELSTGLAASDLDGGANLRPS